MAAKRTGHRRGPGVAAIGRRFVELGAELIIWPRLEC